MAAEKVVPDHCGGASARERDPRRHFAGRVAGEVLEHFSKPCPNRGRTELSRVRAFEPFVRSPERQTPAGAQGEAAGPARGAVVAMAAENMEIDNAWKACVCACLCCRIA